MMNVRNMGAYDPKTEYRVGDVVTFEGGAYRCVQPVKGVSPNTNVRFDVWKRLNQDTTQAIFLMGGGSVDEVAREQISQLSEEIGDVIPDYWKDHLNEKISRVKNLQRQGGKNCYSFVVIADFHHSEKLNHNSPKLVKKIMDDCGIKFCLCLGDIQNGGSWGTKEQELADWDGIDEKFKPIKDRTLMIPGNHDGAYGTADMNGDGKIEGTTDYYIYNLSQGEMYDLVLRKVSLINGVKFDAEKFGYYVDEPVSKVRYILVNTHYSDDAVNADGTPVNNFMRKTRVGQSQINMIVDALQTMPDDSWHAVLGMHIPLVHINDAGGEGDQLLLREMLEAYQNKTTYTNTYGTLGNYDYVSVNVDFSQAKGSVLGAFCGHLHGDFHDASYAFPVIVSASDNTNSVKVNDGGSVTVVSGEQGTITEQSFDVFTVDRNAGVIYATKIGFGEDRMFGIDGAYNVTLNIDGATVSNNDTVVVKNAGYRNVIAPFVGYLIDDVTVTMGGVDVTAAVYANGVINIDSVTGDIVITVTTTHAYTNLADPSSPDWRSEEGFLSSEGGLFVEEANAYYNKTQLVTNYIPVVKNDTIRVKGIDRESAMSGTGPRICFYDENKEYTAVKYLPSKDDGKADGFTVAESEAFNATGVLTYEVLTRGDNGLQNVTGNNKCDRVRYCRVSAHYLTKPEDVIITVNEEIL